VETLPTNAENQRPAVLRRGESGGPFLREFVLDNAAT
jgi:hypothetical protein